ncbi:hypothetical protein JYG23_07845 [Sedimentibacter sp. zth1]|uniref:hypothetical protein n=1 Tax=Sedimentibacter sp. zth1 TaxID=2816908 RepID=UPI001A92E456|nr:hypothetical protein [Sedimentibacter sp. zth1]QSX07245.1 hypothetical protein JYG23_07845 [Sedimentibacter sp. zth1]
MSSLSFCLFFYYYRTKEFILDYISRFMIVIGRINKFIVVCLNSIREEYSNINEIFNNRELAIIFWIFILLVIIFSSKNIRKSFGSVVKALFAKKLIFMLLQMVAYSCFIVYLLYLLGFWNVSLLKSTVIWFFTVAIIASFRAMDKAKDLSFFINVVKDNIKIVVVLQFVTNLYALSFWVEVIFLLFVFLISSMIALIDVKPEFNEPSYQNTKKFLEIIIVIIGVIYIYNSINLIIVNWKEIDITSLVKELMLPPLLSIALIVFNYLYVIYARYEVMFIRLSFKKTIDDSMRSYLKFRIILLCNLNIPRIDKFIQRSQIMNTYIKNKSDVKRIVKNFKNYKEVSMESIT